MQSYKTTEADVQRSWFNTWDTHFLMYVLISWKAK